MIFCISVDIVDSVRARCTVFFSFFIYREILVGDGIQYSTTSKSPRTIGK
jgi:hypothetical protein